MRRSPLLSKLRFVNLNKPLYRKLIHFAFKRAKSRCDKWHNYEMNVSPYKKEEPIYYEFTACPVAEFAKQFGFLEIVAALCNVDYKAMEICHGKLIRKTTFCNGCRCDYAICGDKSKYSRERPEYIDEEGFQRNK